ncbi:MAG: multiheme c-type cytochrome [Planctomycetota bacterium]|nr:multiheme c-type cytochrome [Planctomycetota bacterium]
MKEGSNTALPFPERVMGVEDVLFVVILGAGLLPLFLGVQRERALPVRLLAALVWLSLPFALWKLNDLRAVPLALRDLDRRPLEVKENGYVSSASCQSCHPEHHATWHGSYHRTMTMIATPETVVAPFDGRELEAGGETIRVRRERDEFWVDITDSKTNATRSERIVMTTGLHHVQAYWYAAGQNRALKILPFVYFIEAERWIPDAASYLMPPTEDLSRKVGDWNNICQQCHATAVQPRLENMDTKVAELGIACEACHGPAERHARVNRRPQRRYHHHLSEEPDSTIVNPRRLPADRASEVCGQCHSVGVPKGSEGLAAFRATGFRYRPGEDLSATRTISRGSDRSHPMTRRLLTFNPHYLEERFWSDGMIRISGREYNGLLETPCYVHGDPERTISCLSCHVMHQPADDPRPLKEWANDQLRPEMDGDEACLQCHEAYRARIEEHSHHSPRSSGSRCYNCHMPHTVYGLLKAIRSHTVDSPSVEASVATGRPNACNLCHLDRTLEWAATHLESWYGISKPTLGRDERAIAASVLWVLKGDAGQRALLAWHMGWEPAQKVSKTDWMAPFLTPLLADGYATVRYVAQRSLRTLPGFRKFEYDFLAPAAKREEAGASVWETWGRQRRETTGKELLISPAGALDQATYLRLLKEQDSRRVHLKE